MVGQAPLQGAQGMGRVVGEELVLDPHGLGIGFVVLYGKGKAQALVRGTSKQQNRVQVVRWPCREATTSLTGGI